MGKGTVIVTLLLSCFYFLLGMDEDLRLIALFKSLYSITNPCSEKTLLTKVAEIGPSESITLTIGPSKSE